MDEKSLKILVIDDNPAIHSDFKKILAFAEEDISTPTEKLLFGETFEQGEKIKLPHFQIDTALQGQEGVAMIEQAFKKGNPYALAFVDIRMPPGWNGIETIKHIWAIDPDAQIVICTAYSDYTWEETINLLGEKENLLILKKPFDNVSVRQLAYALTKKWELLQEKRVYTRLLEQRVEERTVSLQYQATHDLLTDLPNRVLLLDRLNQLIEQAERKPQTFAVLFIDIDRFKLINDSLGHAAGDDLLKIVASRLKDRLRKSDTLARFGGDEFIIIATDLRTEHDAAKIVEDLLSAFHNQFDIAGHKFIIGASAGISVYPGDAKNIRDLLKNADAAMYRAKELGGNQFQFYTSELSQQSLMRLQMENDLHRAIINDEFILYYQPQFNIDTKEIISIEALLRWNHPQNGMILPYDFIPLAEETGLIVPIGGWVLKTACAQNKKWQDEGLPKVPIAVNIASKQIKQPDFVEIVDNILRETGLAPQYLEIELTENVVINMLESSVKSVSELKKQGVHIALDDFGTGYSSMSYLRKIPLNRLKIDQSFVKNISLNNTDEVIIQSIITMARELNLQVVAEGVETQKQLEFLKAKHCEEIQGHFMSQAVQESEMKKLLEKSASNKP